MRKNQNSFFWAALAITFILGPLSPTSLAQTQSPPDAPGGQSAAPGNSNAAQNSAAPAPAPALTTMAPTIGVPESISPANGTNPEGIGLSALDASALFANVPELQFLQNMARDLESLQNNSFVKFIKEMFKDAELRQAFLDILQDQNWRALAVYEIVFLLFVFLLRQLEYSKLERGQFFKRIWISLWTSVFTFFGTVLLIPSVHFGQPYLKIVRAVGNALGLPV